MTLEKAIKLNNELKGGIDLDALPAHAKALQIGIEALERIDDFRMGYWVALGEPLPSETKE